MSIIDFAISTTAIPGAGYIAVCFISGLMTRYRRRLPTIQDRSSISEFVPNPAGFDLGTNESTGALVEIAFHQIQDYWDEQRLIAELLAQEPTFTDVVVPFRRLVRPQPSDQDLIALAKQLRYPDAAKWSYKRRLSQSIRADLLKLAV